MSKFVKIVLVIWLLAASVAAGQEDSAPERILLTFIPNIQFAPFYVGIEEGHFAEQGFDVTLEHLQEPEVLDLVAAGQADFGIVSGEQVILARAQGRDVVYVYEWFQQYPVGLVMAAEDGEASLDQLPGMKVGIPGRFGASYSGLTTLLESAGLTENDIALNEIGFNAPEVFCLGAVDAAVVYVNNEPLQIRRRAAAGDCGDVTSVGVISVGSQVDLVSNGLIASSAVLESDPGKVGRMVSAFDSALRATINNPARAYLISSSFVDNLPSDDELMQQLEGLAARQGDLLSADPSREEITEARENMYALLLQSLDADSLTQFEVLLRSVELWDAEALGQSDLSSWQAMRDTLRLMGILDEDQTDLAEFFSNEFVLGIHK